MSNEELVKAIQAGKAEPVELWLQMQKFIRILADKFKGQAEHEDLMQESFFGLLSAVKLYDHNAGSSFATYAAYWIKQAMRRYIENSGKAVRIPVYALDRIRKYKKMCTDFERDFGRQPSDREVREVFHVTRQQLEQDALMSDIRSLDKLIVVNGEDQQLQVPDSFDLENQVVDQVYKDDLQARLWSAVDMLPERQAQIIRMRYQENATLKECGQALALTPERIRQLESDAIRKMRRRKIMSQLEPYVDDLRYSMAIKGGGRRYRAGHESSTERAALKAMDYVKRLERVL